MKRKLLISLLSIACIFSLALGLAACGLFNRNYEFTISAVVGGKRYNDTIKYRLSYTSDEECPNGNIDNEKLYTDMDFEVGKVYYLAVDFTISSFEMDGWGQSFSALFKVAQSEGMEARLEEVATSNFSEKVEDGSTVITATYSIPENRTAERTYRMIIRFVLQSQKEHIIAHFAFYGNNQSNYEYAEKLISLKKSTEGLNFYWTDDEQGYAVEFNKNISETDIYIPEYYGGLPVTEIRDSGFYASSAIQNVFIPDTVTTIGNRAFDYCTNLASITILNSVTSIGDSAFSTCRSLTSITIPDSVTSIGKNAFYNCISLKNITIPDSVTSIGDYMFRDCINLESVTIPDSVTSIGEWAFYDCRSLTSIAIPDSVASIGGLAFSGCTNLESVEIGNSVTSIGDSAFGGCTNLENITIPDSVISIGATAFQKCTSLKSVTIGKGVTSIGEQAFNDCISIEYITVSDNNTQFSSQDGILYNKTKTEFVYIPQAIKGSVTILDSVASIGDYTFSGCTNLISITIPDSVTSIGSLAFGGCTSLTNITIGNGVTHIGSYAFSGCTSLASVTIPDGVTRIGGGAFSGCTSLASVIFENTSSWKASGWLASSVTGISSSDLNNPATAAKYLTDTYCYSYWERN